MNDEKDSVSEMNNQSDYVCDMNIIKNIETGNIGFEWLLNMEGYYIRRSKIGLFGICEIRDNAIYDFVMECTNNIFLYTGYKEWILKNPVGMNHLKH
jgi:hypothetical protein